LDTKGESVKEKGWRARAVVQFLVLMLDEGRKIGSMMEKVKKSLQLCEPGVPSAVYPYVRRGDEKKTCHKRAAVP